MNIEIGNDVLVSNVQGTHLFGKKFEDNLSQGRTLLIFLRHLGCTFTRETITKLRLLSGRDQNFPQIVFVHQGSVADGDALFSKLWPEAHRIADTDLSLYRTFKIERGTFVELFGPQTLQAGLLGLLQGHGVGRPIGDPFLMPGSFLIENKRIVWAHQFSHAGDQPQYEKIINPSTLDSVL